MNTYTDQKFREVVWNSTIPVKIDMAIEDVNDVERPPSLYYNVPRIGYIANIFVEIKANYEKYLPPNTNLDDIWLELNKTPLKWHLPFGVLIDSLINLDSLEIPLNIIAHFRSFPENQVLRYKGRDTLRFNFMNSVKESCTIKYGSNKEALNLSTSETMKLLEIVFNDGKKMFKEYLEINQKLQSEEEVLKKIPIKIVLNKTDIVLNKPFKIGTNLESLQTYTVENFLNEYFTGDVFDLIKENIRIIIHGQETEYNTPLMFYYSNFSCLDNYLYIILINK